MFRESLVGLSLCAAWACSVLGCDAADEKPFADFHRVTARVPTAGAAAVPEPSTPSGERWADLAQIDWELAPGAEEYRCLTRTLTDDVYVTGFTPVLGPGTHHVVIAVRREELLPEGVVTCDSGTGGERRLQGAGPGTQARALLPDGVAMRIGAGEQLHVNVHLFNPTSDVMRGTSGMRVRLAERNEVQQIAEVRLIGPRSLEIPRGHVTQSGVCTLREPATVFSVSPHLHRLGVHATVVADSALGGRRVLLDSPYDFDHQLVYAVEPIQLAAGITSASTASSTTRPTLRFIGATAHAVRCVSR